LKRTDKEQKDVEVAGIIQYSVSKLKEKLQRAVRSDHPLLASICDYWLKPGKRIRSTILLLLAHAVAENKHPEAWWSRQWEMSCIAELIHEASLLHDDVLDESATRRGRSTVHRMFGVKQAILAGDYLLARATTKLARLRDTHVVEMLSTVIEHLVKGELMQLTGKSDLSTYLTKTYYKTASLIAHSCRASARLAEPDTNLESVFYEYGRQIGLVFQIVDDLLDFTSTDSTLGKPAHSDLAQGVVTAPVLFAAETYPELRTIIDRKFAEHGDVDRALKYIDDSDALQRTKQLAHKHCCHAVAALLRLPDTDARAALIRFTEAILHRTR